MLLAIKGNPWNLKTGGAEVDPDPAAPIARALPMLHPEVLAGPPRARAREELARRIYITKRMVTEFGATLGRRGCPEVGSPHSDECRARITAKM